MTLISPIVLNHRLHYEWLTCLKYPEKTTNLSQDQWLWTGPWFSADTLVSSSNKTDCHDITEILLKVVLNTINQSTTCLKKSSICFTGEIISITIEIYNLTQGLSSKVCFQMVQRHQGRCLTFSGWMSY